MPIQTRGFAGTLARATAAPMLMFVVAISYLVPAHILATHKVLDMKPGVSDVSPMSNTPVWKSSYSRHFPGCVASVLWPQDDVPGEVVVLRRSGQVARIPLAQAFTRASSRSRADDVWVMGACR